MLSRKELVDLIKKAPKTHDGYFFFPRFKALVQSPGKVKDSGYFYDRGLFYDKSCFSDADIKMFLSKKEMIMDVEFKRFLDGKINDVLDGIEFLELKDKVPGKDFTLEELIDTTIYLIKYKYSG